MLKKITLFLCVILMFSLVSYSFGAEQKKKYNPFLAGTLSWYNAGLGQIYNDQYLKGGIFFVIDNTLLLLALNSIADVNFNIDETFGLNLNVQLKKQKDIEYNSLPATFFFVSYLAFHFYNVFDAVIMSVNKNFNVSFNFNYVPKQNQVALSCSKYFF